MAIGFVRPARPPDAAEIARIQLSTWRTAYQRLMPRHVLEEISEEMLRQRWSEAVTSPPGPSYRVLVAVEQTQQDYVVGFLASGPDDEDDRVAAITELLVEPRWGRRGHGSRLLAAAVDLWRQDGFTQARFWSFERDLPMSKFLTSAGWAQDGLRRELDVDDLMVPQLRWHVSLLQQFTEADGQAGTVDD
ncbi:MAG TPA: GNAT family N-acetyltransferase [Candidatus Limnocylindrales bacterium]